MKVLIGPSGPKTPFIMSIWFRFFFREISQKQVKRHPTFMSGGPPDSIMIRI